MERIPTVAVALITVLITASCTVPPPSGPAEMVPSQWAGLAGPDLVAVSYGSDPENISDVYLPVDGGNRGVIIAVHGGGFSAGARSDFVDYSGVVMAQTTRGFAIVNIDYRLVAGRTNLFPAAVDDVSRAVRWVRTQGRGLGMNPDSVIVAGHSAGATIAALVALGWNSNPSGPLGVTERVDGYVAFAGIMDFDTHATPSAKYGPIWLGEPTPPSRLLTAASPVSHLDRFDPPGYLAHGEWDNVVEVSQVDRMLSAVIRTGTPYTKLFMDRVNRGGFDCRWHLPQCGVNAKELGRWFDDVVARKL